MTQALSDREHRLLFKTSDLSSQLKCSNNMVAMYLSRRKHIKDCGIYQATGFTSKKESRYDAPLENAMAKLNLANHEPLVCDSDSRSQEGSQGRRILCVAAGTDLLLAFPSLCSRL